MTVEQKITDKVELQDHLDTVRKRIEGEGLSRLELKLKYRQLVDESEDRDLIDQARDLAKHEAALVQRMLEESEPPPPTQEEVIAELASTNPVAAEALAHQFKVDAAKQAFDDASETLQEMADSGVSETNYRYTQALRDFEGAQKAYEDIARELPPAFQREQLAQFHLDQAESLRLQSTELLKSPESHLKKQGEELLERAEREENQASVIRAHVPSVQVA